MVNKFLIIELAVYVELSPQVAACHNAAKTKFLGFLDVVQGYAAECVDMLVYQSEPYGVVKHFAVFAMRSESVSKENVFAFFFIAHKSFMSWQVKLNFPL